jgi:hypothetical protein
MAEQQQVAVVLVKLDGKEYVQGSAAHVSALEVKLDAAEKAARDHADQLGKAQAKVDAAEAKVKELEARDLNALASRPPWRRTIPSSVALVTRSGLTLSGPRWSLAPRSSLRRPALGTSRRTSR